ncbi:MAG: GNAT family N-acetyltransferase [Oscillospiraceae bacterium]|nr:GNAT family N-acetyltransferase [Oscillospiraceae bacterium]
MRVDIRPAIYSDLSGLTAIKLMARGESAEESSARFENEKRYLTAFLDERQSVFVQLIDRQPIAFCAVREGNIKPFIGFAYIKDMYVCPKWQSKGFGKKLLMHVLRTKRGEGYMRAVLDCAVDNAGARRFYERFGFVKRDIGGSDGYVTYTIDF